MAHELTIDRAMLTSLVRRTRKTKALTWWTGASSGSRVVSARMASIASERRCECTDVNSFPTWATICQPIPSVARLLSMV
jgi:hypothetical protein